MIMDEVTIHVTDRENITHQLTLPTDITLNLMEACIASELPIISVCGGMGLCGGCHAYILSDHAVPPVSDQEAETLEKLTAMKSNSRLLCQIPVNAGIQDLQCQLAPLE
jgi:2Fe-2S ferredoxin